MFELEEDIQATLAGHVWQTARQYPRYTALELGDRRISYQELYRQAAMVARAILDLDTINPYVAVMADKSFFCYAGILGILMAGKAYLPLNPRFPAARNVQILEKALTRVVIAGENSDDELDEIMDNYIHEVYIIFPEETDNSDSPGFVPKIVDPREPAYLLFTSGTTGAPKGVPVSNQNVTAYIDYMLKNFDFRTDDRFTQLFDLTFDLSVHDIFLAWSKGACVVVPQDNSSFAMSRFIRDKRPTVWFSVPSVAGLMEKMRLLKPDAFPSLRMSFFCGEALQVKTAVSWKTAASESSIINLYGPTEATIAIAIYELPENQEEWKSELGIVSIGKIFEGNNAIILNAHTDKIHGELCLSGEQVVKCYLENEEADKTAFFTNPGDNLRYYKTGDLVKADEDGDLFFLGRTDSEVKISGYRVNLKEIENMLEKYETVKQAVVLYEEAYEPAGVTLAFVEALFADKLTAEKDLDDHCRHNLPWYMVPGKIIFVEEMPLNMNGKIDKSALKEKYYHGK